MPASAQAHTAKLHPQGHPAPAALHTHNAPLRSLAILCVAACLLLIPGGLSANPQAHLVPHKSGESLPSLPAEMQTANERLIAAGKAARGKRLAVGDRVPSFALYNQEGEPVLAPVQWRGKYVVVSFIFTRCKMATMCPAATAKMATLQRVLDKKGLGEQVQLVSISFDPHYDTPAILKQYAQMFGADLKNYSFLTGSPEVIKTLLHLFGVLTISEKGTINHTMATLLLAPDGTLAARQTGPDWTIEPFIEQIEAGAAATIANGN